MIDHLEKRIVCPCFGVTEDQIKEFLSQPGATYEALVEETGVGSKCTACLLDVDLILQDYLDTHAYHIQKKQKDGLANIPIWWEAKRARNKVGGNFALRANQPNVGMFINTDNIKSSLHIPNYRLMFDGDAPITSYDYKIIVRDERGRRLAVLKGELKKDEVLDIDFSKVAEGADYGWFVSCLYAHDEGLKGTTRPQILLIGDTWASTIHPQTYQGPCYSKAVQNAFTDSGGPLVFMANVVDKPCRGTIHVDYLDGLGENSIEFDVSPYGARLINVKDAVGHVLFDKRMILTVNSDQPLQKFILNRQFDGSLDLDHFPDR